MRSFAPRPRSDVLLFDGMPSPMEFRISPVSIGSGDEGPSPLGLPLPAPRTTPMPIKSNMRNVMSSSSIVSEHSYGLSSGSCASTPDMSSVSPNSPSPFLYPPVDMRPFTEPYGLPGDEAHLSKIPAEPSLPARPVSDFRKFKTSLCRSFLAGTECPYQANCIFAHGEAELRSETNNETLRLAHEILGATEEQQMARRRTRRRRRGKGSAQESGEGPPPVPPTPAPAHPTGPLHHPLGPPTFEPQMTRPLMGPAEDFSGCGSVAELEARLSALERESRHIRQHLHRLLHPRPAHAPLE